MECVAKRSVHRAGAALTEGRNGGGDDTVRVASIAHRLTEPDGNDGNLISETRGGLK